MAAKFTTTVIEAAIHGFEAQKKEIDTQIAELRAMLNGKVAASSVEAEPKKRRKLSLEVRKRMKAAQQLRWAKIRGEVKAPAAKKSAKKSKPKGGITEAGRKALSIAMKKRWAAKKAA